MAREDVQARSPRRGIALTLSHGQTGLVSFRLAVRDDDGIVGTIGRTLNGAAPAGPSMGTLRMAERSAHMNFERR